LDPNEISNVILASRPNGVIRVSDVATVRRGPKDREVVARVGGKEAVELAVYKEGDANTVAVARAVKHRVDKMQLGSEYKLVTVADQSRFIENSINEVINSAWQGGLLAVLVLFLFLRNLRTTLIIALSIPISVFATFVIMYRFGISLNLMSLGGLALAVGMLVDNSIVVLESIFRKREEGLPKKQAASEGAGMVAMAVTASTLTTVAGFLPLVFVEGLGGQLLRDQGLTISFSLLASLAVALTIVPTLAGLGGDGSSVMHGAVLPAAEGTAEGGSAAGTPKRKSFTGTALRWVLFVVLFLPRLLVRGVSWLGHKLEPSVNVALDRFHEGYEYLIHGYPAVLRRVLARPERVLAFAALLFVGALAVGFFLPRNLFPPFTQGEFHFNIRLPEGTALAVTDLTLERLEAAARKDPRVKLAYTSAGQTDLSAFAGSAREANRGQIAVLMKKATDRRAEEAGADELRDVMNQIPGLTYEFERPALLTFKNPVEVEVYAYDLDTLRVAAGEVADRLEHVRGLEDVESSVRSGDPEVQVTFDRARLAAMNLDPAQASRLVRNAVQGEAATQFSDLD